MSGHSDHVFLATNNMDQIPDDMQQGFVRFLNAGNAETGHDKTVIADGRHAAAIATGDDAVGDLLRQLFSIQRGVIRTKLPIVMVLNASALPG